ncbi:VCBS repeat-containing protein [Patescibacteria group bacterium]|nr:VCBS repeat-containing protein [Patescibacteria group bacterium]
MLKIIYKLFIILLLLFFPLSSLYSQEKYPKLANYYLSWDITDETAKDLAKWDLLILSPQAVDRNSDLLHLIKKYNPQIKILAYFLTQEIHQRSLEIDPYGSWGDIFRKVNEEDWWLKDLAQNRLNFWPDTYLINVADKSDGQWNHWLGDYINDNFLKKNHLWDGIFFDNCWPTISWLNFNLDLNNDGYKDSQNLVDQQWSAGMQELLEYTRKIIGENKIVVCNGGTEYKSYYNGRMFESFPVQNEGGWSKNLNDYQSTGPYSIINSNTKNSGDYDDSQTMRFGLVSALLGNGYFSFDYGDQNHGQLWWYEEYDNSLGQAENQSFNLFDERNDYFFDGSWRRDFENGIVLVNSTTQPNNIKLEVEYEKIRKEPSDRMNIVNSVELSAQDGIILLKPLKEIIDVNFKNGTFARVFNKEGQAVRNGFFAYQKEFLGGEEILIKDINKDGKAEIIVASDQQIFIYQNDGSLLKTFYPYGENYHYGLNFSVGDLDGNGQPEIITAPLKGVPAHIKTFSIDGRLLNPGFFAYPKGFRIGADIALADINGDGRKEIITVAGKGGGSHVRIFNKDGKLLTPGFFTFEKNYRGGLNIATGDVDGDSKDEIVVSRKIGDSEIKIFKASGELLNQWLSFSQGTRGVDVTVSDIDGNGIYEIIALGGYY